MGLNRKLIRLFYFVIILISFVETTGGNKNDNEQVQPLTQQIEQIDSTYTSKRIGILSLPISSHFGEVLDNKVEQSGVNPDAQELNDVHDLQKDASYYPKSYHKWLKTVQDQQVEIVPIEYYSINESNIPEVMEKLDGILLTGGGTPLFEKLISSQQNSDLSLLAKHQKLIASEYTNKVIAIIKEAERINSQGRFFPLWGTCLGFESMLIHYASKTYKFGFEKNYRNNAPIQIINLETVEDHMYKVFTQDEIQILQTQNISYFNHREITFMEQIQKDIQFQQNVHFTATALTKNTGSQILAAFQVKNYPFYAVQYHPEKAAFEKHSGTIQDDVHKTLNNKLAQFFVSKVQAREYDTEYSLIDESQRGSMEIQNIGHFESIEMFVPKTLLKEQQFNYQQTLQINQLLIKRGNESRIRVKRTGSSFIK